MLNTNSPSSTPFDGQIALNGSAPHSETASTAVAPLDKEAVETRAEAQPKAAKAANRAEGNLNDPISRPRDEEGQPKPRPLVYLSPGLLSGRSLQDTNLPRLLEVIAKAFPAQAEKLAFLYEDGVRFNKTQFDDLDRLAREELANGNAEIERRNRALTALQGRLEREMQARTKSEEAALLALDNPLSTAHREAAKAVSGAGGDYDPAQPNSDCVLRARPLPLQVVTGINGLPWTPSDNSKRIPSWLLHILKFGVGAAIGVSVGLLVPFFEPSNIGQKGGEVLVSLGLGYIAAAGGGMAVRGFTAQASERYWLARFGKFGPMFWVPATILAGGVAGVLMIVEAVAETLGLLGAAKIGAENNGGETLPWFVFFSVGLLVTVGYIGVMAIEGARDGRSDVIHNRAQALQHEEFVPRDKEERADEKVRNALEKLAVVREVGRQVAALQTRIQTLCEPFQLKIEKLETLKREPQNGLSPATLELLRDAHDNWAGPNGDWLACLDRLLTEIEPIGAARRRDVGDYRRNASNPQRRGFLARLRDWWQGRGGR